MITGGGLDLKFFRAIFLYILYFVPCFLVAAVALQSWGVGSQMLFTFFVPAMIVWWRERKRFLRSKVIKPRVSEPSLVAHRRSAVASVQSSLAIKSTHNAPDISQQNVGSGKHSGQQRHGWVSLNETVSIAGRDIGGMIYVGIAPAVNANGYSEKCKPFIDASLPVSSTAIDKAGAGMPYWPSYSAIPPQCRAAYLEWLRTGRSDSSFNVGYMFLYFYGLERRFIIDRPSSVEKQEILAEVLRLKALYSQSGSAQRYLEDFIQLAQLDLNSPTVGQPVFDYSGWEVPLNLKVILGAKIARDELLSADWLLSWFLCHPERSVRTPAKRCASEFRTLFKLRFDGRFPEGLKISKPRKQLKTNYRAASGEFQIDINPRINGQPVLDISGLRKPIEIAQEIAEEAMGELDKLSRYLGRNPEGAGSVEAQALLPSILWPLFPSKALEQLKLWASECIKHGGLVSVTDVILRLDGSVAGKISTRQLTDAADALARIGFGMAPDPRFALRAPKIDEPVVIFELGSVVETLENVSQAYQAALIELALGTFIAHADGQIAEGERRVLESNIDGSEGLTDQEKNRLRANLIWLLVVPPDMQLLRRKLKDIGPEKHDVLRSAVVAIAHADSIVQSQEVSAIEKIYKALGLNPSQVYSDLHEGSALDAPVRVKASEKGVLGEAIPMETPVKRGLDVARISAIRSDTERVSSVLGEIFSVGHERNEDVIEVVPSTLIGLDLKHTALVRELIELEKWSENAFAELTSRYGLMPSGALEIVNEWSFEKYDEALIDEYDGYDVAPDIAGALKLEFEKRV